MKSETGTLTLKLILSAQRGDSESRSRLAEMTWPKVYAYCYRMTLDAHVAEDLSQETMVSLFKYLERLTFASPGHLWAWTYKTALNQIRDYGNQQHNMKVSIVEMHDKMRHTIPAKQSEANGPNHAIREELLHTVTQAIDTLKLQYRSVLILRCFQQLSYTQIGQVMGRSELGVRMLFFRAKQSLTRQLARDGFKSSQLLPGLSLFAAATLAPTEASAVAVVSHVALQSGLLVKILTWLSTAKVIMGLTGVAVLTTVSLSVLLIHENPAPLSFHQITEDILTRLDPTYPVALVEAYDPDQSGWQGALVRDEHSDMSHYPVDITLEQWINNPTGPEQTWIHMPRDHWLQIDFGSKIIDGPGDDVFVTERCHHGEVAEVYLINPAGQECLLGLLQIAGTSEHGIFTYGFDLAEMSQRFDAQVVRIRCVDNGSREFGSALPGMELLHVRARTR